MTTLFYACDCCHDCNEEGCAYTDRNMLRVLPDGETLCEACFDDAMDDSLSWDTLPVPEPHVPAPTDTSGTFLRLWDAHAAWSVAAFGSMKGPTGPLEHLKIEADEAIQSPDDPMEFADCLFLIMDAARRAGHTPEGLLEAAFNKLDVLKTRTYLRTAEGLPSFHEKQ